jgi:hypothetical protein
VLNCQTREEKLAVINEASSTKNFTEDEQNVIDALLDDSRFVFALKDGVFCVGKADSVTEGEGIHSG